MPLPPLCPPVGARALIEACREPGQAKRLEPLQVYNRRQILRHALLCISVALAKDSLVSIVATTKPTQCVKVFLALGVVLPKPSNAVVSAFKKTRRTPSRSHAK